MTARHTLICVYFILLGIAATATMEQQQQQQEQEQTDEQTPTHTQAKEEEEEDKKKREEEEEEEEEEGGNPIDVVDFFPEVNEDVSQVKWGHAINSVAELKAALDDPSIMMLEADILLGHLSKEGGEQEEEGSMPPLPIMAHPPHTTSDLTFTMWLQKVIQANKSGRRVGVKLDFKEIGAVKDCLVEVDKRKEEIVFPVWLNADILPGPTTEENKARMPVPLEQFLPLCTKFCPQATLSVGWTTYIPPNSSGSVQGSGYTREHVAHLVEALEAHSVAQPVTFPIRAAFIPHSLDNLEWLVDTVPDSSVTIWNAKTDPFDPVALATLRELLGYEAVYIDLPPSQMTQYQEVTPPNVTSGAGNTGAGQRSLFPIGTTALMTVGMGLASALAALYLYEG